MNWLQILLKLGPIIIAGVGAVVGDSRDGKSKKAMATHALQIATQGAADVDPNDVELIQASSNVAGLVIDDTINDNKAAAISTVIEHNVTQLKAQGILPPSRTGTASDSTQGTTGATGAVQSGDVGKI